MSETIDSNPEEWGASEACYGLLFLLTGVLTGWFFVGLVTSEFWPLVLVAGWGWLMAPLLVILGANALWESARAALRRIGDWWAQ